jgi:uncharacterized protein YjeT (DUF2065 family)
MRWGIGVLVTLEGAYFFWLEYALRQAFADLTASASNQFRLMVGGGLILLGVGLFSKSSFLGITMTPLSLASLVYGVGTLLKVVPIVTSWWSPFEGDIVALEAWSACGFIAIGIGGLSLAKLSHKRG